MAIVHSNEYAGFGTSNLDYLSDGYDFGIVTPIWNIDNFNSPYYSGVDQRRNYTTYHVATTPQYVPISVGIGTTEYRRHKAYISPTGSPYLYDTGDIFTELKPIKYYWAWRHGDYGHGYGYKSHNDGATFFLYNTDTGNIVKPVEQNSRWNVHYAEWTSKTSPHWMLGFSLCNSGEQVLAGIPHAIGSGSTTTTQPDGMGGFRMVKIWMPYMHGDPDKAREMNSVIDRDIDVAGNVQLYSPEDLVHGVHFKSPFGYRHNRIDGSPGNSSTASYAGIPPADQCVNSFFGPFYPETSGHQVTVLNDIASFTGINTTPQHPYWYSKAWGQRYILPPTGPTGNAAQNPDRVYAKDPSIIFGHTQWEDWGPVGVSSSSNATFVGFHTDISGNQKAEFGYSCDCADGFFIGGAPGYYGGTNNSRANRGAIGVFMLDPVGANAPIYDGSIQGHTTDEYICYSRREGENPGDRFGHAVACGYNRYIVGAPGFNGGQGKAYLYADVYREHEAGPTYTLFPENDPTLHWGTWQWSSPETAERAAATGITADSRFYGHASRVWGLKLIKELTPVGVGQSYGYAVSIGNGRIAVSNLAGAGSVEIFNLEGNRIGILTAPDGQTGDCFGRSVDIRQGIIAVGAPHATVGIGTTNVRCGAVYAFDRNRVSSIHQVWRGRSKDNEGNSFRPSFLWKQHPPDGADGDRFGDSLDIGSGRVLVGAPFKSHFSTPSADGSAYCFNLHGNHLNTITAAYDKERNNRPGPGIRTDSHFGHAVTINGHTACISAPFHGEYIDGSYPAMDYEYERGNSSCPDNLFFYYTPQCVTVWDTIDQNYGKI